MLLEEFSLSFHWRRYSAARDACHNLAKDRGMVLGLRVMLRPLDAQALKRFAQLRKRAPIESTRQIVRCIGLEPAASERVEEVEILYLHAVGSCFGCGFGEGSVRRAKRACITTQDGKTSNHSGIGALRKQCRKQRVLPCARAIDIIDQELGDVLKSRIVHLLQGYYRGKAPPCA